MHQGYSFRKTQDLCVTEVVTEYKSSSIKTFSITIQKANAIAADGFKETVNSSRAEITQPWIAGGPGSIPESEDPLEKGQATHSQCSWASLVAQLVKNPPIKQETWVGKIPWRRERLPTPVFWPGEFHGLYSPRGCKELDTTERLSFFFLWIPSVFTSFYFLPPSASFCFCFCFTD